MDGAYAERVLQHLPDLPRVIGELGRVLRPGARLVVLDTDWESLTIAVGHPETARAVRRGVRIGMVQPALGAILPSLLIDGGFLDVTLQRSSLETSVAGYDVTDLNKAGARAVAAGLTDAEAFARWCVEAAANDHSSAVHLDRLILSARRYAPVSPT